MGIRLRILALLLAVVAAGSAVLWLAAGLRPKPSAPPPPGYAAIGRQGDAPGQFQRPRGIAGFPDGSFVVVDRAGRVQHFSADGKPLHLWRMRESANGNPKGLCVLPNGHLLICDTHYSRLLEMTVEGGIVKQWGGPGLGPGQFTYPLSAAADAGHGAVYVAEYGYESHRVHKFTLDGAFVKVWGSFGSEPGQFQRPSGVAVDPGGNVYVADSVNHRIQKFDAEGKLLKVFGEMGLEPGKLRYPYDIACGPDKLLYVAEFNNHRVSVFDTDGNFVRVIGSCGSGAEEFAYPWSLTVDARGRLLVSDTGNCRVQIINVLPPVKTAAKAEGFGNAVR